VHGHGSSLRCGWAVGGPDHQAPRHPV